jgi:hypothetical protein
MAINLILSNKNIEQFVDISSGEIFVPDDIIHPGVIFTFLFHQVYVSSKTI